MVLYSQDTSYKTFYIISSMKNAVQKYNIWIICNQHYISFLNNTSQQYKLYILYLKDS
jgi:hypothetical protein